MSKNLTEFRSKWLKEIADNVDGNLAAPASKNSIFSYVDGLDDQPATSSTLDIGHDDESEIKDDFGHSREKAEMYSNYDGYARTCKSQPVGGGVCMKPKILRVDEPKQTEYIPFVMVDNLLNKGSLHNVDSTESTDDVHRKRKICYDIIPRTESDSRMIDNHMSSNISGHTRVKKTYYGPGRPKLSKNQMLHHCPEEDLVMKLVSDINEITEIPFFDIDLPRELAVNIFANLDMLDLCRCCQVSKSWRSLAEDDLLWHRVARGRGFELGDNVSDRNGWKALVTDRIQTENRLVTNWKGRIGELSQTEFVQGGVLRAVDILLSHNRVAAGYSTGQVRLSDLSNGDACTFNPSSVALDIDESCDQGTVANEICHVKTCPRYTVAAYTQGNVDVWSNSGGTEPDHSFKCSSTPTHLEICPITSCIAATYDSHVVMHTMDDNCFNLLQNVTMNSKIIKFQSFETNNGTDSMVAIATNNLVKLHRPGHDPDHMTEIHNLIGAPVTAMDVCGQSKCLAVGVNVCCGPFAEYKVKLYDLDTHRLLNDLQGHTWIVGCVNLRDSPPHCVVTGCGDRRVRVYDTRTSPLPTTTLVGHAHNVSHVQADGWKVVSGDVGGVVVVWDTRMACRLWQWHNRHPVAYCRFKSHRLYVANIPQDIPDNYDSLDAIVHRRYRGSIQTYNFLSDQTTPGLPDVCLSTYDVPEAYNYSIRLAMPYDNI